MILTNQEETFLKSNHVILESIFNKRIEDLKEMMINSKEEERNEIAYLITELRRWLKEIKVEKKEIKKDNEI